LNEKTFCNYSMPAIVLSGSIKQSSSDKTLWKVVGGGLACAILAGGVYCLHKGKLTWPNWVAEYTNLSQDSISDNESEGGITGKVDQKIVRGVFAEAYVRIKKTGNLDSGTLDFLMGLDPDKQEIECRILISKFLTLYIQVQNDNSRTSISERIPTERDLELCTKWLRYEITEDISDEIIGETVNSRLRLAFLSNDVSRVEKLYEWAKNLRKPSQISVRPHTYLYQRLFQMSCVLGCWEDVEEWGKIVARFTLAAEGKQRNVMHKWYVDATKTPSKSFNYLEIFLNVTEITDTFDNNLSPKLRFSAMDILTFETKLVEVQGLLGGQRGSDTLPENSEWKDRYQLTSLEADRRKIWVYGAVCQLFCPSAKTPFLLAGALNETQIRLTGQKTFQQKSLPNGDVNIEQKRVSFVLEIEKKSRNCEAGKECWLWEGLLEVPRHKRTQYQDSQSKEEKFRFELMYNETYQVRMNIGA